MRYHVSQTTGGPMGRHGISFLVVLVLVSLTGCSESQAPVGPAANPAPAVSVESSQPASPVVDPDPHTGLKPGQPARYDDGFEVAVLSATRGPKDQEGYDTALIKVRYVNKTPNQLRARFSDWYVEDAEGNRYDTGGTSVGFYGDNPHTMDFEDIAPGRTFIGLEAIRLPKSVKPARVGFADETQTYRVSDWNLPF